MKTSTKNILLLGLIISGFTYYANAQVQYNGCSVTGTYASAIGKTCTASGNNAFAGGYGSQASGSNSFAFGYNSKATQSTNTAIGNTAVASGKSSVAIGNYVKTTAQNTFIFGSGATSSYPLTNNVANSIAFGVNSNQPTMLITKALNNNYTGKVAIGQVATPEAKLHIRADNNEDAGVFLEPSNKNNWKAFIKLFDDSHTISVDNTTAMKLNSGNGPLNFEGESYCFGRDNNKKARIYTDVNPSFYLNARRNNGVELRDIDGTSYAIDFSNDAILFRTAASQSPKDAEITNWNNAISIASDGSVGINTTTKVSGFALAVDGGIISTKVHIKEVNQWPDVVFSEDYPLMALDELKDYLNDNKHLPGVPSEQTVLESGYDINEMQYLLLEKIEEMTRYILILNDEINHLKQGHDTIQFSYDANGNRISRSLVIERIANHPQDPALSSEGSYDLFPNPTTAQFHLVLKEVDKESNMHATLLTSSGAVLEKRTIVDNVTTFDLSGKSNGVYILEIKGLDGVQTWKVIKQ